MDEERRFWDVDVEASTKEAWTAYQDELVRRVIEAGSAGSLEIAARLRSAGIGPGELRGVSDLARVPTLPKDDLPALQATQPPFGGMLAVPLSKLRRVFLSPGPILDPEGAEPDFWRFAPALWAAGFRSGQVVHNSFAYHLTPAGAMLESGLAAVGCTVLPGGVGNTEWQLQLLCGAGATGYVGTPTYLLTLVERAAAVGVRHRLRRAFVSGAPLPSSLRQTLQEVHGLQVLQGYGTADAGTLGYECAEADGWHVAPGTVVEVVEPATGEPVGPGVTGEVVVSIPSHIYPLLRFGTGDLSAWTEDGCTCGRTTPRLVGFLGRVGDGVKVRGMFVHPDQLQAVVGRLDGVVRLQAIVSGDGASDELVVRVEPEAGAQLSRKEVALAVREAIKLRATVQISEPGSLDQEALSIIDERTWD